MDNFERIKTRYYKCYVTFSQLQKYCELNVITPEQFKEICGLDYTKPVSKETEYKEALNILGVKTEDNV